MARIRKTVIDKEAALEAAGMPPSVPTGLKKRKPRSAAKIRELKRSRAAKRAAADVALGSTVDNTSATEARTTGDPRDVSEEAGSLSVEEDRSSLAAEATTTHPDSSGINPVTRAIDSLTSTLDCTDVVTDQATANQAPITTNQNDADELEGNSGTWVCLVCTWSNTGDVEACTSCKVERSTSPATATDHDAIAGTDPIAARATDQTAAATDQVADATDSMYYPIYGQYYSSDRVTVSGDYATTKKTWQVARINNRREPLRGREYQVLWVRQWIEDEGYYIRTYEPEKKLREDGFVEEMALVERWKSSKIKLFENFWRKDEFGKYCIGADSTGLCMFNALKRAAEQAGRPDIVTQSDIDKFVADELADNGQDITKGTTWMVVLRFLRRIRDVGPDFVFSAIAKKNFAVDGRRGARVLGEISLVDGVYLV
ncbi:hypothetical protein PC129_g19465 [Phytophthora cactorum]|uniref:RanBP2-type domain-containing protein n=3 Tax=Phytophthora cactorum TaxID=29920 RepID=A0A8T1JX79_9STRA|nr:hypothetical protein Pcac1_g14027 [Phytophthora cactorum]KAG2799227.1 hypothetical protein PC112_g20997 [Phytophthora cactorum]KAG2807075.1 hypothetical protein PC111_g17081 [Phytophthora cactorum]KAG2894281.1 hypothetical protein PC115_g18192 [Phytophthora cactorum]KAG2922596.1 hypothetical protein PC114_g5164 [Phytophthora cactorum]